MTPQTKTDDPIAKRRALRDAHPDSWIAVERGDSITGKLVDATEAWSDQRGDNGSFYPLLTIRTHDDLELKVHCFGAVLFSEVMRHRPEIGETITITYLGAGEAKRKGFNAPELYRLRVAGRTDQAQRMYNRIDSYGKDSENLARPEPDVPIDF
jgi:hypothetical protein